ncbi:MAG: hypothetical protein AB1724_13505 [Thermodesulfobacteriota bacterium]
MTVENDVVLIYFENKPMVFARVESITPDHKKGWYLVKLLILGIPLHTVYWLLKEAYIDGAEFTMDGKTMRLEKVVCPPDADADDRAGADSRSGASGKETGGEARVIPFPGLPES